MKIIKIILAIIIALLAMTAVISIISKIINYDGSPFNLGDISGSIAIVLIATAGSIMLFKSAFKKPELSENMKET